LRGDDFFNCLLTKFKNYYTNDLLLTKIFYTEEKNDNMDISIKLKPLTRQLLEQ